MKLNRILVLSISMLALVGSSLGSEFSTNVSAASGSDSAQAKQAQKLREAEAKESKIVLYDYEALDNAARQRLAQLISDGARTAEINSAAEVLDAVARARYLAISAQLSEQVTTFVEGFKPQLAAAPHLLKQWIPTLMKSNEMPTVAVQVVTRFLEAKTKADAQLAVGDMLRLVPAMEARDKAMAQVQMQKDQPADQFMNARRHAGDQAFNTAWNAAKATEQVQQNNQPQPTPRPTATLPN